jgi:hypothetical protein
MSQEAGAKASRTVAATSASICKTGAGAIGVSASLKERGARPQSSEA